MSSKKQIWRRCVIYVYLLSTITAVAMWAWSHFETVRIMKIGYTNLLGLYSSSGRIYFVYYTDLNRDKAKWHISVSERTPADWTHPSESTWSFAGFSFSESGMRSARRISIPYWFLFCMLSIPTAIVIIRMYRNRGQHSAQRCENCGYDLRASSGNCPECGQLIAK